MATMKNWQASYDFPEINEEVAIDTETKDPSLKARGAGWCYNDGSHLIGISLATESWSNYFPIRHEGGGNLDEDRVLDWLKIQLGKPTPKVFANAQYDVGFLAKDGVKVNGKINDILIGASLIDEHRTNLVLRHNYPDGARGYNLDSMAFQYLGRKKVELDVNKSTLYELHANEVAEYAIVDAELTYQVWQEMKSEINTELAEIYELETSLIPVLLEMRCRGVRIDMNRASELEDRFKFNRDSIIREIERETGQPLTTLWSATKINNLLIPFGVEAPLTPKSQKPSITSAFLQDLDLPIANKVLSARKYDKAISTYLKNVVEKYNYDGRVHCTLRQLKSEGGGAVSGRFSCSSPNLQNQPAPDKDKFLQTEGEEESESGQFGGMIRSLWLPEKGDDWVALDYSQQEPRFIVHFSAELGLKGADEAVKEYNRNPDTDYHQLVADLADIPRKTAKTINLGLAYGMGGGALCESLGLATVEKTLRSGRKYRVAGREGQAILDGYDKAIPFVRLLAEHYEAVATNRGQLRTYAGRRCTFPKLDGKPYKARNALNRVVQGSGADQTKIAMTELYKADFRILISVHDEIAISVKKGDKTRIEEAKKIMINCCPLLIPSKVDIDVGATW